jgi:hypothetical protein
LSSADFAPFPSALDARAEAGRTLVQAGFARLLDWCVALWIFSGALVFIEPSPYELIFLGVVGIALFGGFALHRSSLPILGLFALFIPFAIIGAFQVKYGEVSDALIFVTVTIFLVFTAYFVANYVIADTVNRMRLINSAYTWAALLSAVLGVVGYLGLIPGAEFLTRYDRAKALFQDPNVYGPFLILPAAYALQRVLLGRPRRAIWGACIFLVLTIGVFVSFSRGAWIHLAITSMLVFLLCFLLEATVYLKIRMIVLATCGVLVLVVALGALLSIPTVQKLFETRTQSQNYDTGDTGRFGRQAFAFDLALEHPLGIGPLQFRHYRVVEEPHNTYVSVLHGYGWGGGLVFYGLIFLTAWRGIAGLFRGGPNRLLLIPLVATFLPLAGEAAIIDIDHWRHLFLVIGLIWGVTGWQRSSPKAGTEEALV